MNFLKLVMALIVLIAAVSAAGARPGRAESYLMLARSDYFRIQVLNKLAMTDRATLKQRIKNAKLRAAIKHVLSPHLSASTTRQQKPISNNRLNRFKKFHHWNLKLLL